jgi:hypothetical protein
VEEGQVPDDDPLAVEHIGAVLNGSDQDGSDLDLLTPADLPPKFRPKVLAEALLVRTKTACPSAATISARVTAFSSISNFVYFDYTSSHHAV